MGPCPFGGGRASRTKRSTVNRAIAVTVTLSALATIGSLWVSVFFLSHSQWGLGLIYLVALAAVLGRSYAATQDFRKQVSRQARRNPALARQYEHLWYICKKPHLCDRCKGWLAGVGAVLAGWLLAVFFYGYHPSAIADLLGAGWATVLGAAFLFITPISSVLGRLDRLDPKSFWESGYGLGIIGFLNALAAPILASVAFQLVLH